MTPTQRRELERLIDSKVSAAIGYGVGAYAARETLSKAGTALMHYLDEITDYSTAGAVIGE